MKKMLLETRKKGLGKVFLTLLILGAGMQNMAQTTGQYTFATSGTASLAIELNGNTVDMTTGTTTLVGASNDDLASAVTNIGFSFQFANTATPFTQFSVSSNGAIRLGATAIVGNAFGGTFPVASQAIIAPYWGDLATSSTGKVHYKLLGSSPNRTLVIEFLNMGVNYNSSTVDATFQARLYEQTNVIEYVYGAMKVNSTTTAASRIVAIGFSNSTGANNQFSVNQSTYATSTSATAITNTNSSTGTLTGLNSTANGSRRSFTFTPTLPYKSQFLSINAGSANWCSGETRTVSVTVKNIGTATWTNSAPDVNIGVRWNINGTSWTDYHIRTDANGLVPGATQTYSLTITAADNVNGTYGAGLAAGTNNLTFDIVKEGDCWLGDNGGTCGPGNLRFTSANQTINALPTITLGTNPSVCRGATTANLPYSATTGSPNRFSVDYSAAANTAGFIDVINATGTTSPLVLTIPSGVAAGTYSGTLTVNNATTGCVSNNYAITVTVLAPTVSITGATTICTGTTTTLSPTSGGTWTSSNTAVATVTNAGVVTGTLASGASGTATFTFTQTSTGCSSTTSAVTVNGNSSIALSSAAGTNAQTICTGNAITNITYAIGGGGTGASITAGALPAGLTTSFSGGVFTISGSPSVTGTFNYTVTTTGPCVNNSLSGTITINANSTISLSSAAGTNAQTICTGAAITNITYAIGGGGTGASITAGALPAGLTTSFSGGVFTISGTPSALGTFNYTVTTAGPCVNNSLSGTITINANSTMSLSSAAGTNAQTICTGAAITNITYAIGGGGTGASITAGALPSGVTGSFSGGVFTISGTPSALGTFNYTVTTAGPCVNNSLSGTITINANSTISLSSAVGTNAQTICTGAAITNITYAIGGGGTGASITAGALPSGVTGSFSGGVFTISGTPSALGTFNYTVTTAGPCVNNSLSGTITIRANSTISLSSAAGTNAQTICTGAAITNITYAIGGGGTGASITAGALPSGVTGSFGAGVFTISGTPSALGTFNYTVTTAGPCVNNSLSGTITIRANSTISLSSAAGTNAQTICIGSAITNITYAIGGGGTGASVTAGALPSGVTGSFGAGVFTISGTPSAIGTFNYTVTTAGPCVNNSLSGTITVNANSTIGLSSAAGSDAQVVCVGNPITSITYAIGGGGTGASITAGSLPTGVTGSFSGGVFTLNGTATTTGTFNYTVTTTGPCTNNSLNGTITVNPNSTISLSTAPGTDAQTVCVGTAIASINYAIGGSGTGASITAGSLPTGVTGSFSAGVFSLNGTPTATGTFNYTITTAGPCINNSLSGTITVSANSSISLSSAAGSDAQTVCLGTTITNITYAIGGSGTGAAVTAGALPSGITASYNGGVFTLNGTPTVSGTFNYTVTTAGPCTNNSLSGTITVTGSSSLTLSSAPGTNAQTICLNSAIANISYTVGGTATSASITAGSLPTGVSGSYSGGVFTISGTATESGAFNYTVTTSGPCGNVSLSGAITVSTTSAPVGSNQTVCADGDPEQTLTATATGGTITWYDAATGGNIVNSPVLTGVGTVTYYAQAANGSCTSATRTAVTLTINPSPGSPVGGGNQTVCSNGDPNQTLIATATSPDTITWYDAATNGNAVTPAQIGIGSSTFYAEATNGSCVSPGRAAVTLAINPVLATPGTITGPLDVCPLVNSATPSTYTVPAVAGATSYSWLVPAATTVVSGQGTNSIQVTFDNAYGQTNQRFYVTAEATNACTSASSILEVLKNIPGIPAVINGPTDVCPYTGTGANATYTIDPVAYATSYTWNIIGNGTIISGQGTTSIQVSYLSTFTSGNVQVTANSNCGNRAPRSINVAKFSPNAPANISGPVDACSYIGTATQATYSVTAVPYATSYIWTVPANVSLISGQGTASINVTFNSGYTTASIKVKSVSACSSSSDRSLSVVAAVAGTPGVISGPSNACSFIGTSNTATYVIRPVLNASGYVWSMPVGASIVSHPGGSGINDTIITVAFTNNFVSGSSISVQAVACVAGAARTFVVSRIVPATPGVISGATNVCPYMMSAGNPSGTPVPYSIRAVLNATSYSWSVPPGMIIVHPNGAGVNDTIIQVTFTSNFTTGSIAVSASSECGASAVKTLALSKLIPGTPGGVTITQTGSCPNRQYSYSIPMPTNTTSLVWTAPGTIVSGQGTTTIVVAYSNAAVTGTVTVTPYNNCSNGSTRSINISLPVCSGFVAGRSKVAVADDMEMKVNVSPNPAVSDFKVQVVTSKPGAITMRILDLQGKEFSRNNPRPNETILFGNNLKAGVYLLEVRQGDVVKTTRLVKF